MARVKYVDADSASSESADPATAQLAPALAELPRINVFGLMAGSPGTFLPWLARHVGVTEEQIEALERSDDRKAFDPTQRAVLTFVAAFVRDGVVSDDDYAVLAGLLSDREITEVAFVAAQYLGLARMFTALQIDADVPVGPGGLGATARVLTQTRNPPNPIERV